MSEKSYRCGAYGNLARFEMVMNRLVWQIDHVGIGGNLVIHRSWKHSAAADRLISTQRASGDDAIISTSTAGAR